MTNGREKLVPVDVRNAAGDGGYFALVASEDADEIRQIFRDTLDNVPVRMTADAPVWRDDGYRTSSSLEIAAGDKPYRIVIRAGDASETRTIAPGTPVRIDFEALR